MGEFTYDVKVPEKYKLLANNSDAVKQIWNVRREIDECIGEILIGDSFRYPNGVTALGYEGWKIMTEGPRVFEIINGDRKVRITIELYEGEKCISNS
jgi:hypothetical protein